MGSTVNNDFTTVSAIGTKRSVMGFPSTPIKDTKGAWHDALSTLESQERSLYIHIPFCRTHCPFCPFYLLPYSEVELDEYVDLLIKELKETSQYEGIKGFPFNTVYFGGGTPTDLSPLQFEKILKTINKYFQLANDCEITVEGRVNGFSKEKMTTCLDNGVNRFSIGVQTFNTILRRSIGRIDDKKTIIKTLETLASSSSASVVIDLLYGLPNQSLKDWIEDNRIVLEEVRISGLDHYRLNLYKGLKLNEYLSQRKVSIPSEDDIFLMFKTGMELLNDAGASRLSIHHFSLNFHERNAHNELGSKKAVCIQCGIKAAGRISNFFFRNTSDFCEYRKAMILKQKPISYAGKLPKDFTICSELNYQIVKRRAINPYLIAEKDSQNSQIILNTLLNEIQLLREEKYLGPPSLNFFPLSDLAQFEYKKIASDLMKTLSKIYRE